MFSFVRCERSSDLWDELEHPVSALILTNALVSEWEQISAAGSTSGEKPEPVRHAANVCVERKKMFYFAFIVFCIYIRHQFDEFQ